MIELAADSVRTQTLLGAGHPLEWREGRLAVEVAGPMRSVVEHRREELEVLLRRAAGRKVTLEVVAPEEAENTPAPTPSTRCSWLANTHWCGKQWSCSGVGSRRRT
ncbi:MAG: hypothetical protein IPJ41_02335 [Phycisphaerales bacterium]|nr:hypothetical protein [Phycisphaerales bacterium]